MRVSAFYKLGRTQPTLDFVDVDIANDTALFLSPRALMEFPSDWGNECVYLVQNFFETVLQHIKAGRQTAAVALLQGLREPNETHLGLSKGQSRGRALGNQSARDVWGALSRSEAAKSGLLQDLEDTVLMVEGISVDIVSDITTNIIRGPLILYTQDMCELYGIPTSPEVPSGPLWDAQARRWTSKFEALPITRAGKLLLIPKAVVRRHLEYDAGEYYRHYLLEHLRSIELSENSALVELLKNKKRRVTKKKLVEKYGSGKQAIVRESLKHPEVLERYREIKKSKPHLPLPHEEIADIEGKQAQPNWAALLEAVRATKVGTEEAQKYEAAVEALLSALFYPVLSYPKVQHAIHAGRKRIDIAYTNMANEGFFKWVSAHYPSAMIFVECKNYGREVGNPELDQLSGRFSPGRGQVGMLVCRGFDDKARFLSRCRDTAADRRGYILALDDDDLEVMVKSRVERMDYQNWPLLRTRMEELIG